MAVLGDRQQVIVLHPQGVSLHVLVDAGESTGLGPVTTFSCFPWLPMAVLRSGLCASSRRMHRRHLT